MKHSEAILEALKSSNDFLKKAEKLINSNLSQMAVSPLYLSLFHIINALATKNGFSIVESEALMKWFQEFNEKEKLFNSQFPFFVRKLYAEKQNIEYKAHYEVKTEKVKLWQEEVIKYRQIIEEEVKKLPDYGSMLTEQLKAILKPSNSETYPEKKKIEIFNNLKNKVLLPDSKVIRALNELLANPNNLEYFGAFKIRLEDFIDNHPEKLDNLSELLNDLPEISKDSQASGSANQKAGAAKADEKEERAQGKPKENHPILIPWDFTKMAEYALEHAVNFVKITNGQIYLIHIVKNESEHLKVKPKLDAEIQRIKRDHKVDVLAIVRTGTIFKAITGFAEEIKAKLVIMGTHGKQGMQKFTGSWALKVIINTKVPFLVVQSPPKREEIRNVVFPVDYRKEIKQKVNQARYLSKYYDLKFFISKPAKIAIDNVRKKTLNNLYFMRSFFIQYGIEHEVVDVRGTKNWSEATLKLASDINADLIIIVLTKELGLPDMLFGAEEEKIIMNPYGIPVMCVNPPAAKNWTYSSGFG